MHVGYGVAAVGYMLGISLLSSSPPGTEPGWTLISMLAHVPLFAGLSWCLLLSFTDGEWERLVPWRRYLIVGAIAGGFTVFDVWHGGGARGPLGRLAELVVGIPAVVGLLLFHWLWCRLRTRAPAASQPAVADWAGKASSVPRAGLERERVSKDPG